LQFDLNALVGVLDRDTFDTALRDSCGFLSWRTSETQGTKKQINTLSQQERKIGRSGPGRVSSSPLRPVYACCFPSQTIKKSGDHGTFTTGLQ
ncbi:hypothetical protein, partial [Ruegeria sp. HKCCE4150]|uniref:hypothetical protein n=1 Tax=Ruegeria sp. HKCCE4150 TaxID=2794828 RepID=UPI001AEB5CF8